MYQIYVVKLFLNDIDISNQLPRSGMVPVQTHATAT